MKELEDLLKHHGVLGMKWGVRRDRKGKGGADGKTDPSEKKRQNGNKKAKGPGLIKQEVASLKRHRTMVKAARNSKNMSTKEIKAISNRLQQEIDFKKLYTTPRMLGMKERKQFRTQYKLRAKMSDAELARKVGRLRTRASLHRKVNESTKVHREVGKMIVQAMLEAK